ncbi:MAG: trigger factor [Actinomycetota bacterium]|nr:trigger factor [Actinomycetota bacterium]
MKTVVEPVEGNKVKLSVEVDEQEFDKAVDAAFRKIAHEVRIPGFRPGKAPRKLLEARVGADVARQEALREALPDYYAQALKEADVDAIAPPEIDITAGQEGGAVAFDAVVEVRPQVSIAGYGGLRVTVPGVTVTDEDVDRQLDRLRNNFGELRVVERAAADGDHVTIDLKAEREGSEPLAADDYLYEVGSGLVAPELDEHLRGAKPGDIVTFESDGATYRALVKEVKEKILPEATDEWASEASEFETLAELREDIRKRLSLVKKVQASLAIRDETLKALVELVTEDAPEPLVREEMEHRLHDLSHRLQSQGGTLPQYLEATGTSQEQLVEQLQAEATQAVKADLALRALVASEGIEADDDELDREIERLAQRFERKPAQLRRDLERGEGIAAVRSDVRKAKALAWLVEHVEVVDEEGNPIDRAELELPTERADESGESGTEEGRETE